MFHANYSIVRRVQGIAPQAMQLFHDALKGLHFLHSHGWLHGDIKPANIGIIGARAVLLDIGTAIQLRPHALVPPTPGGGGTIWYLAPEREMQHYNYLVDVWSMGVIGYELTYGYHPWKLSKNPWRPGKEHESLRPVFHAKYREASHRLDRDKAITGSQNHQQNKCKCPITLLCEVLKLLRFILTD